MSPGRAYKREFVGVMTRARSFRGFFRFRLALAVRIL